MLKKLILTLAAASFGAAAAPAADEIINPVMRLNDKARIDVYNRETGIAGQFDSRRFVGTDDWVKIDFSDVSDLDANVIDRAAPAPLLRAGMIFPIIKPTSPGHRLREKHQYRSGSGRRCKYYLPGSRR